MYLKISKHLKHKVQVHPILPESSNIFTKIFEQNNRMLQ